MLRKLFTLTISALIAANAFSQPLTAIADGGNKKASVMERIGITDITIHYDRPAVKGREGKIWGGLVHKGYMDLQFGTSKAAPWRAGANENTTFTCSTDILIEGKPLKAGTYGFFIAMGDGDATLIFSNNSTSWGSFFYDPKEDALQVKVKTVPLAESVERLKYEFSDETENSAVVSLVWEKLKIPFKVEVDYVQTQLESFRRELRSDKGFDTQAWVQAAQFCVQHNTNLDEALAWSEKAVGSAFPGKRNFQTLSTKALVLDKMGRSAESAAIMKEAMSMGSMQEVHGYGRQLLAQGKSKEALEVFKLNAQKNPNVFTTKMGLVRGYSATGDYKSALKYAKEAYLVAPDKANKDNLDMMMKKLSEGKDAN